MPSTWRRRLAAACCTGALVLTACGAGGPAAAPTPTGPDLTAIRDARSAYAGPAQALGTAARAVVAAGRLARLEPAPSGPDGTPDATARSFTIDELEQLLADLEAVLVDVDPGPSDEPAVASAADHWADALREGRRAVAAGREEVVLLRDLLEAESALAGITALWDQPGSRSQQIDRFQSAVQAAGDVAEMLAGEVELPACSSAVARRRDAALLVAARSQTLLDHVRRYEGRAFDEARAEYELDPWHADIPDADADEADCWQRESGLAQGTAGVEQALASLVEDLNPESSLPSPAATEG